MNVQKTHIANSERCAKYQGSLQEVTTRLLQLPLMCAAYSTVYIYCIETCLDYCSVETTSV